MKTIKQIITKELGLSENEFNKLFQDEKSIVGTLIRQLVRKQEIIESLIDRRY